MAKVGLIHGYPPTTHARIIFVAAAAWLLQDGMVQKGVRYRCRYGWAAANLRSVGCFAQRYVTPLLNSKANPDKDLHAFAERR